MKRIKNLKTSTNIPNRILWTWDHSTNWNLDYEGQLDWGCTNAYLKPPKAFLDDYKRIIKWSSRNGYQGIIIWGFLRDSHGGIKAAQQLCEFANKYNVRILPGVGTSYYGGIYYEGEHIYNSLAWLKQYPAFAAIDKVGSPMLRLCPSEPANQDWLRQGIKWLLNNFEIGGVNLESGDFMVCYCKRCHHAREELKSKEPNFFKEMLISISPVVYEINHLNKNIWVTYGTYTGFNLASLPVDLVAPNPNNPINFANMGEEIPFFISKLPINAITQWSLTAMLQEAPIKLLNFLNNSEPDLLLPNANWPEDLMPPGKNNMGLILQGSQWYARHERHTRYSLELAAIKETCLRASKCGFQILSLLGEVSPNYTANELNYLAFSYFCDYPNASLNDFAKDKCCELLGGEERALEFMALLAKFDAKEFNKNDMNGLSSIYDAKKKAVMQGKNWSEYRRWLYAHVNGEVCDGTASVIA
jgi:hypothetical protein